MSSLPAPEYRTVSCPLDRLVASGYRLDRNPLTAPNLAEQFAVEIVVLHHHNGVCGCQHRAKGRNGFSTTALRRPGFELALYDFGKVLTISRDSIEVRDPGALALSALGWVLADDIRAERFLSLTGLTPDALRTGLGEPAMQCAVLDFLGAHEPDLVAAADALAVPPKALIAARDELSGGSAAR